MSTRLISHHRLVTSLPLKNVYVLGMLKTKENIIGTRTTMFLGIAFFVASASAQNLALKGHHTGETVQQFLAASPALSRDLAICRQLTDNKSAKKQRIDLDSCQKIIQGADNNADFRISTQCNPNRPGWGGAGPDCLDLSGTAEFSGGKLANLYVSVQADWEDAYRDMVKVWGEPTRKDTNRLQNGYGATFDQMQVVWVASDSTAIATQGVGTYPMHIVEVTSNAYLHAKTLEKENNHKSTIE